MLLPYRIFLAVVNLLSVLFLVRKGPLGGQEADTAGASSSVADVASSSAAAHEKRPAEGPSADAPSSKVGRPSRSQHEMTPSQRSMFSRWMSKQPENKKAQYKALAPTQKRKFKLSWCLDPSKASLTVFEQSSTHFSSKATVALAEPPSVAFHSPSQGYECPSSSEMMPR